jgi:hypothetical protein
MEQGEPRADEVAEVVHGAAAPAGAERRAATPVAGAVAGILFAVLFAVSTTLLGTVMANVKGDTGAWLETDARTIKVALALIPFAGIFFLWFIAVSRERLGRREDQFFATVMLGSGLLFLALTFAAAAAAGAILAAHARHPSGFAESTTYTYARQIVGQIFSVYALRMAAVFQISQATLWLRTGVMPRWMAWVTYAVALVLLFVFTQAQLTILVFPAWVLMVSVYILILQLRRRRPEMTGEGSNG